MKRFRQTLLTALVALSAAGRLALAQGSPDLAAASERLTAARNDLLAAEFALPRNDAAIRTKVEAVRAAELSLTTMRAPVGRVPQPTRTSMPHVTASQATALIEMSNSFAPEFQALTAARASEFQASLATPRDEAAITAKLDAMAAAEITLANARADAFGKLQASANRIDSVQIAWLIASGGTYNVGFTEPEPYDFDDHRGYISLFDGVSLKGWDGNPKFWRVEGGAIVGESTAVNPSGNTYIAYRDVAAHDFTLKFEIKIEGDGGSGIQYRSKTGIPWSRPIAANVTANVGPVNLNWMMTGPQADFWPSRIYSGQFYSENTPMGIMAYRGEVVEGAGLGAKRLMGTIGDRTQLGTLVNANNWNQYTVIARGGTFIHLMNGQLMAVMVDDDPASSNNWSGIFGIEIEATTKVSVRNIWLKKLN
jgi:hypothetical protein